MPFDLASATVAIKADLTPFDKGLARARSDLGRYLPSEKTVTVKFHTPDVDVFAKGFGGGDRSTYRMADENQKWVDSITRVKTALATVPAVRATRLELITSGFTAGLVKAKTALKATMIEMKATVAGAATSILPLAAIGVAAELAHKGIKGASDLAESTSKMEVTFAGAAGKVKEFAAEMSSAFGTPNQQIFDAATEIGLLGKGVGMTADAAADLGVNFSRMAADASSFFNTSFEEALHKMSSGLRGESEPLTAFGVMLNEDAVKAEAFAKGIAKVGKELTTQQKIMARASLIEKGLAVAEGDRARTAGGFSNQLKELADRVSTLATTIGGMLTPVLNPMLRAFNAIAYALQFVADTATKVIDLFGDVFSKAAEAAGLSEKLGAAAPGGGGGVLGGPAPAAPPPTGVEKALDAARATVEKEREGAGTKIALEKARDEAAAKAKLDWINKINAGLAKERWIREQTAKIRAGMTLTPGATDERRAIEAGAFDKRAREMAENDFKHREIASGPLVPKGDISKPIRDASEGVFSKAKEALAKLPGLKQQGLGVLGGAANALAAQGDQARLDKARRKKIAEEKFDREVEKRRHFTSQIFQGGADYHNSAQASILQKDSEETRLNREQREKNKEIAANTKQTVVAMNNLASALLSTLKGLPTGAILK